MTFTTAPRGLEPCGRIGFDISRPIWSESAALFVTSADGTEAVSLRLCRYPSAGTAWLWAHVFTAGESWSYNVDHLPCPDTVTDVEAPDAAYGIEGTSFTRVGDRTDPRGAHVALEVHGHPGAEAPDDDGAIPLRISGRFTPAGATDGTLPGRSELLGQAEVIVELPDRTLTITGHAQFHEQHQDDPRFVVPFTYATLRGPDRSLVALIGPRGSRGFVLQHERAGEGARVVRYDEVRLPEPDGGTHPITLVGDDHELAGDATVVHSFTIPVYGQPWWGTLVSASLDGHAVTGSVNRWRFPPEAP